MSTIYLSFERNVSIDFAEMNLYYGFKFFTFIFLDFHLIVLYTALWIAIKDISFTKILRAAQGTVLKTFFKAKEDISLNYCLYVFRQILMHE